MVVDIAAINVCGQPPDVVGEQRHVQGVYDEDPAHKDQHLIKGPTAEQRRVLVENPEEGNVHDVPNDVHADAEEKVETELERFAEGEAHECCEQMQVAHHIPT